MCPTASFPPCGKSPKTAASTCIHGNQLFASQNPSHHRSVDSIPSVPHSPEQLTQVKLYALLRSQSFCPSATTGLDLNCPCAQACDPCCTHSGANLATRLAVVSQNIFSPLKQVQSARLRTFWVIYLPVFGSPRREDCEFKAAWATR